MSIDQYASLTDTLESKLDEAAKVAESTDTRYTLDEVVSQIRTLIDEAK